LALKVPVTIRSSRTDLPLYETVGFVPDVDCPLAATHSTLWDVEEGRWRDGEWWQVTHRATGFYLGAKTFRDADEALAVIARCDPTFPAWQLVRAGVVDAAMLACRYKFRMAVAA
jgi:hypothetical protein